MPQTSETRQSPMKVGSQRQATGKSSSKDTITKIAEETTIFLRDSFSNQMNVEVKEQTERKEGQSTTKEQQTLRRHLQ